MDLRIAARKSDLARLQAYQVGKALEKHKQKVSYYFRQSLGDINQEDPLWQMPEKGVFTEDFREGLVQGQWDMVVHSWKDLPVDIGDETEIVATLKRADVRDLFLFKRSHLEKVKTQKKLRVFSSSPRRIYNLQPFFKNYFPASLQQVEFKSVRGNIQTRMQKMMDDDSVDGLIVAKAAIDRLLSAEQDEFLPGQEVIAAFMQQCRWQVLPVSENPTAAAQGALAVEIKSDREDLKKLLAKISCQTTWDEVVEERKILKSYGGGCHQKIGVNRMTRDYGDLLFLRGETDSGEILGAQGLQNFRVNVESPFSQSLQLFARKPIDYTRPSEINAHFVARASALPEGESFSEQEVVWASGLKTWKALAERGIWVNGSSESMGEHEDMRLQILAPEKKWGKWSHSDPGELDSKELIATYSLHPQESSVDLAQYSAFFWMSGTQFEQAVKQFPQILNAQHFCSPGNTFPRIVEVLEKHNISKKPVRLPSRSQWLEAVKE